MVRPQRASPGRSLVVGLLAIAIGAAGTAALRGVFGSASPVRVPGSQFSAAHPRPPYVEDEAILFGSPTCGASSIPGLTDAAIRLVDSLRVAARARGDSFTTVGVSIDGPFDKGAAWLKQFGAFDEIVIGRNWLNSAVATYIWADAGATPAIPQLVLVRHRVAKSERSIQLGPDSVVRRWIGVGDLAPAIVKRMAH